MALPCLKQWNNVSWKMLLFSLVLWEGEKCNSEKASGEKTDRTGNHSESQSVNVEHGGVDQYWSTTTSLQTKCWNQTPKLQPPNNLWPKWGSHERSENNCSSTEITHFSTRCFNSVTGFQRFSPRGASGEKSRRSGRTSDCQSSWLAIVGANG